MIVIFSRGDDFSTRDVKNKLIRIIVALVRKKVPYDQNTYKYYEEREVIERKKNEKLIYC